MYIGVSCLFIIVEALSAAVSPLNEILPATWTRLFRLGLLLYLCHLYKKQDFMGSFVYGQTSLAKF